MKRLLAHLRRLMRDVLFLRVCVAIYGIPIAALGVAGVWNLPRGTLIEWLLLGLVFLLSAWGLFMTYAAFFGSLNNLSRAAEGASEGGEIVGLVFLALVVLVALPVTATLRAIQRSLL
jgi:hypothetical protein